jgi:hypothetical protein
MDKLTTGTPDARPPLKWRHGCLTFWLVLMLIVTASRTLTFLLWRNPSFLNILFFLGGLFNLVCIMALFRWKKWGFWGLVCSGAFIFIVNLAIGVSPYEALWGLVGIPILYGILHIGREWKAWTQLE